MRNERFSSRQWRGASFHISPLDCFSRPATLQALYGRHKPRIETPCSCISTSGNKAETATSTLRDPSCSSHSPPSSPQPTTMISCRSDIHDQPALRRKRGTAQGWHVQHMIIMTTTDHETGHQGFHPDRQPQSVYPLVYE